MTGPELRAIRQRLGLTIYAWGLALGYEGPDGDGARRRASVSATISKLERAPTVPTRTALLAEAYERHGLPDTSAR